MFAPSKSVAAKICPTICQFSLQENVTAKALEAEMSLRRVCLHLKGPRNFCPTSLFVFVSFPIFFSNRFYRSVGWSLPYIFDFVVCVGFHRPHPTTDWFRRDDIEAYQWTIVSHVMNQIDRYAYFIPLFAAMKTKTKHAKPHNKTKHFIHTKILPRWMENLRERFSTTASSLRIATQMLSIWECLKLQVIFHRHHLSMLSSMNVIIHVKTEPMFKRLNELGLENLIIHDLFWLVWTLKFR